MQRPGHLPETSVLTSGIPPTISPAFSPHHLTLKPKELRDSCFLFPWDVFPKPIEVYRKLAEKFSTEKVNLRIFPSEGLLISRCSSGILGKAKQLRSSPLKWSCSFCLSSECCHLKHILDLRKSEKVALTTSYLPITLHRISCVKHIAIRTVQSNQSS